MLMVSIPAYHHHHHHHHCYHHHRRRRRRRRRLISLLQAWVSEIIIYKISQTDQTDKIHSKITQN